MARGRFWEGRWCFVLLCCFVFLMHFKFTSTGHLDSINTPHHHKQAWLSIYSLRYALLCNVHIQALGFVMWYSQALDLNLTKWLLHFSKYWKRFVSVWNSGFKWTGLQLGVDDHTIFEWKIWKFKFVDCPLFCKRAVSHHCINTLLPWTPSAAETPWRATHSPLLVKENLIILPVTNASL